MGCALYDDFNIAAKQREELHESFGRKTGKLSAQQTGNLWLVDLQYAGGAGLCEPPRADCGTYPKSEMSLGQSFFWIGKPQVGKYIAGALFDHNSFGHGPATPF